MSENKKIYRELPIENIVHRTASRPFSLYRTVVGKGESCALYRRARFTLRSTKRMKHFPAAIALWCLTPVC